MRVKGLNMMINKVRRVRCWERDKEDIHCDDAIRVRGEGGTCACLVDHH